MSKILFPKWFLIVFLAVIALSTPAAAADTVLGEGRLVVRHDGDGGHARFKFRGRGTAIALPVAGSENDPSLHAGVLETFTGESLRSSSMPLGSGWKQTHKGKWRYRGGRGAAIQRIVLSSRQILILHKDDTAAASGNASFAGIRLRFGDWSVCARFAGNDILDDENGLLRARHLTSSELIDCSDESLAGACVETNGAGWDDCLGSCSAGGSCEFDTDAWQGCRCVSPDMPCGDTAPVCGGICATGLECKTQPAYPVPICRCEPPGASCGNADYPTCGGVCNEGETCSQSGDHVNGNYCACLVDNAPCGDLGPCPEGTWCGLIPPGGFICVPNR